MFDDDEPLTAERVEDGTYFLKAREWYSTLYHYPMTERVYYVILIFISLVTTWFSFDSFNSIFPLSVKVPFLVYSNDAFVDNPVAKLITNDPREDKNVAVMRYMIEDYVVNRESYDLDHYEFRYRNIAAESSRDVFEKYKDSMDATNLYSPYRVFTSRFKRIIELTNFSFDIGDGRNSKSSVEYYASIVNVFDGQEVKRTKHRATLVFHYDRFSVDQSLDAFVWVAHFLGLTGDTIKASGDKRKVIPMKFIVSGYESKELLE